VKNINFNKLAHDVEPIIKAAGALVLDYFHKGVRGHEKPGNQGMVTEADKACEQYLIQELGHVLPEAGVIAEESGAQHQDNEYCWVIDPVDGTTNFIHQLPYFCVSVALTYCHHPVFAAIYQPITQEYFWAAQGQGAFVNGKRMQVSRHAALEDSLIVVGLPYAKNEAYDVLLKALRTVAGQSYAIRHFGAAALDLAYVAAGRLDGVFFADLRWWDVAAGMLLVMEAGGKVTDFDGLELTPAYQSCIAAGAEVHGLLMEVVTHKV
jgi:myo-inositol-1(or 4)-monophosphatase